MHFFFSDRQVFDPFGNNDKLAFLQVNITIPQFDQQVSFHNEEQLVLVLVLMPDKLALEFGQLDVGVIELACNLRAPVLLK